VVHAPTGAGKTHIFELYAEALKGQAVFTVPTRALANDKFAEWTHRGFNAGICTGDVALRLEAPWLVATLETQKGRFLAGTGPRLLAVDEYQMLGDPIRGANYELAIALAPPQTQLLLLSGSVANPGAVVEWLQRIGREAVLIQHRDRPVPLQEVDLESLPVLHSQRLRDRWPRLVARALAQDLAPILLFAPRRQAAEELARQIASQIPLETPLKLSPEQETLAGPVLAKLLRARVAFHHSGLSYRQRAGLVEPLAKSGALRAVVATMGLAAGINFSMRSVAITGTRYKTGHFEREVQPDELLQMFGRAGRRGLDDSGFALVADSTPRLPDARPRPLRRATALDWPTLIAVMDATSKAGGDPFNAAAGINRRLFTPVDLPLGIERGIQQGPFPCKIAVDLERIRFHRRGRPEILNSLGNWQACPQNQERAPLGSAWVQNRDRWIPALASPDFVRRIGSGALCKIQASPPCNPPGKSDSLTRFGREILLGNRSGGILRLAPWLRRIQGCPSATFTELQEELLTKLAQLWFRGVSAKDLPSGIQTPEVPSDFPQLLDVRPRENQLWARFSLKSLPVTGWVDEAGKLLIAPPLRTAPNPVCSGCAESNWCASAQSTPSPADWWRQLGLIDPAGHPTPRGQIFSFFQHGEGLAIAAALEDTSYPIDELVFDLANLRAGERFADEDPGAGNRLATCCLKTFCRADLPGYLELGIPTGYGAGASPMLSAILRHGQARHQLLSESIRAGDLERAITEWRSLLRHILWAPDHPWERWRELRDTASKILAETQSAATLSMPNR
jgi:hypothetical protein